MGHDQRMRSASARDGSHAAPPSIEAAGRWRVAPHAAAGVALLQVSQDDVRVVLLVEGDPAFVPLRTEVREIVEDARQRPAPATAAPIPHVPLRVTRMLAQWIDEDRPAGVIGALVLLDSTTAPVIAHVGGDVRLRTADRELTPQSVLMRRPSGEAARALAVRPGLVESFTAEWIIAGIAGSVPILADWQAAPREIEPDVQEDAAPEPEPAPASEAPPDEQPNAEAGTTMGPSAEAPPVESFVTEPFSAGPVVAEATMAGPFATESLLDALTVEPMDIEPVVLESPITGTLAAEAASTDPVAPESPVTRVPAAEAIVGPMALESPVTDAPAAETLPAGPAVRKWTASESHVSEPVATEALVVQPVVAEPLAAEPVAVESVAAESVAAEIPESTAPTAQPPVSEAPAFERFSLEPFGIEPFKTEATAPPAHGIDLTGILFDALPTAETGRRDGSDRSTEHASPRTLELTSWQTAREPGAASSNDEPGTPSSRTHEIAPAELDELDRWLRLPSTATSPAPAEATAPTPIAPASPAQPTAGLASSGPWETAAEKQPFMDSPSQEPPSPWMSMFEAMVEPATESESAAEPRSDGPGSGTTTLHGHAPGEPPSFDRRDASAAHQATADADATSPHRTTRPVRSLILPASAAKRMPVADTEAAAAEPSKPKRPRIHVPEAERAAEAAAAAGASGEAGGTAEAAVAGTPFVRIAIGVAVTVLVVLLAVRTVRHPRNVAATAAAAPGTGVYVKASELVGDDTKAVDGVRVWVDGRQVRGAAPLALDLVPGPHSVRVERGGEQSPVQLVQVPSGHRVPIEFQFGSWNNQPRLSLVSRPMPSLLDRVVTITAYLDGVAPDDAQMDVAMGETGTWRNVPMAVLPAPGGSVGVAVLRAEQFRGHTPAYYVTATSKPSGNQYFTDIVTTVTP